MYFICGKGHIFLHFVAKAVSQVFLDGQRKFHISHDGSITWNTQKDCGRGNAVFSHKVPDQPPNQIRFLFGGNPIFERIDGVSRQSDASK